MKKRFLATLLCVCMVFTLLPAMSIPALAVPGDTAANPVVCNTFAEFKAAMEGSAEYIQLNSVNETIAGEDTGKYTYAIYVALDANKTLILNGDSTFTFLPEEHGGLMGLMVVRYGSTLTIAGSGTIKTIAPVPRYVGVYNDLSNAVVRVVKATLNVYEGVTLYGDALDGGYGRAVEVDIDGTLNLYGGNLLHQVRNHVSYSTGAVKIDSGTINIESGTVGIGGWFDRTQVGIAIEIDRSISDYGVSINIKSGFLRNTSSSRLAGSSKYPRVDPWLLPGSTATEDLLYEGFYGVLVEGLFVDDVELTVPQPIAGQTPSATPATTTTTGAVVTSTHWYQSSGRNMTTPTFVAGETYRCAVIIHPATNYSFRRNSTRVTFNGGNQPTNYTMAQTDVMTVYTSFSITNPPISSVAFTVDAPLAGQLPQQAKSTTEGVVAYGTEWYVLGDGSPKYHSGPFVAGNTYRVTVYANTTSDLYPLASNLTGEINAGSATIPSPGASHFSAYRDFTVPRPTINVTGFSWDADTFIFDGTTKTMSIKDAPTGITGYNYGGAYFATYVGNYNASATPIIDETKYTVVGSIPNKTWRINPVEPVLSTAYGTAGNPYKLAAGSSIDLSTLITGQHTSQPCTYAIDGGSIADTTLAGNNLSADTTASVSAPTMITVTVGARDLNSDGFPEYLAPAAPIKIYVEVIARTPVPGFALSMDGWEYEMDSSATLPEPMVTLPDSFSLSYLSITYRGTLRADDSDYATPFVKPSDAGSYIVTAVYDDGSHYGSATASFTIDPKDIAGFTVSEEEFEYCGNPIDVDPGLTYGSYTLAIYDDFVSNLGSGAVDVGTYPVTVSGLGNYFGYCTGTYTITPKELTAMTVVATAEDRAYLPGDNLVNIDSVTFDGNDHISDILLPELGVEMIAVGTMDDADVGTNKNVNVTLYMTTPNHVFDNGTNIYTTTATISKAVAPTLPDVNVYHKYDTTGAKTASVAGLMPTDAGTLSYALGTLTDANTISSGWSVNSGSGAVGYSLAGGTITNTATQTITISSDNYMDATAKVIVNLADKDAPTLIVSDYTRTYNGNPVDVSELSAFATFGGVLVDGTWSIASPPENVSSGTVSVTFTPDDMDTYKANTVSITIAITPAHPIGWPTFTPSTLTLGDVVVDVTTILDIDGNPLAGTFAWTDGNSTAIVADTAYDWTFTPTSTNYSALTGDYTPSDTTAPTLSNGSASGITQTEATLFFTSTEDGDYAYLVYAAGNTAPNTAEILAQGTAVNKGTGTANLGVNAIFASGLTASTAYKAYIVAQDETGNTSNVLEIPFTTLSAGSTTPPSSSTGGTTTSNSVSPATANFDKTEGAANNKDVVVTLTVDSGSLSAIKNGSATLVEGTDYTKSGNTYTIKASYLETLPTGTATLTFDMSSGADPTIKITVSESGTTVPDPDGWVNPFTDVLSSDWFYDDMQYVHENGLFAGTSANTFSPQLPMTRGMVVTVLGRLAGIDIDDYSGASFDDVDTAQWYAPYAKWAAEIGIVSGIGNNNYAPNADISRQDLAAILYNYAVKMGITLPETETAADFDDGSDIAGYATAAVTAMQKAGIINGKPGNVFDPQGIATRAEVAAMLHRFAEAVK